MPELSRFFGIIIRMYREVGEPHSTPHFHAHHQDHVAVYGIRPFELIAGSLPQPKQRLVEAWVEFHEEELLRDWNLLASGHLPESIKPLD